MDLSLTLSETALAIVIVLGALALFVSGVVLVVAAIRNEPLLAPPEYTASFSDGIEFFWPTPPWTPPRPFDWDRDRWDW